jgi:hypothetical protein
MITIIERIKRFHVKIEGGNQVASRASTRRIATPPVWMGAAAYSFMAL